MRRKKKGALAETQRREEDKKAETPRMRRERAQRRTRRKEDKEEAVDSSLCVSASLREGFFLFLLYVVPKPCRIAAAVSSTSDSSGPPSFSGTPTPPESETPKQAYSFETFSAEK